MRAMPSVDAGTSPILRNWERTRSWRGNVFVALPLLNDARDVAVHLFVPLTDAQPSIDTKAFSVFIQPPGQTTTSSCATSSSHSNTDRASSLISAAKCVIPALMYNSADSARSAISADGNSFKSLSSCMRTAALPSRIRGRSLGRMTAVGRGIGSFTGPDASCVVRYARASFRWVSVRDVDARER